MTVRIISSVILVTALSLFPVHGVSAHSTEPRLEISLERLHPGEVMDVRGVNFGMDETVILALLGTSMESLLGEVTADAEGVFVHTVTLPVDLAEGAYQFQVTDDHHAVLSPVFNVWGTAVETGGGQGPRDEDDGLLAPMPTLMPVDTAVPAPVVSAPASELPASSGWIANLLFLAGLMIVVAIVVFGFLRKKDML